MTKLLIRADDLGYSEGVNLGIAKTVEHGLVQSVGVMVNMPTVEAGLSLLKGYDICLGQHTNICLGKPILPPEDIPSLCQENGEFRSSKCYREAFKKGEDFVVLEEVVKEIEAQYHRFVALTGQEPSYFEGHAVASPNFFKGLEIVAAKYHLPYFAMSMDGDPVLFGQTKVYSRMPKDFVAYENNPFSVIEETVQNSHEDGCDLLVFHPGYIDAYLLRHSSMTTLRAYEADMLIQPWVSEWLKNQNINLVTYKDLK